MKKLLSGTFFFALLGLSSQGVAQTISMNFIENAANQIFAGGQMIGPLETDSAYWNDNSVPTTGDFVAGTQVGLIDGTGAATGVDVQWQCSNIWYNGDGTNDDEHKLSVGYLDDGDTGAGKGVMITFTNVPYANYTVYGLFTSDFTTGVVNYDVNGTWALGGDAFTTAPAYGSIEENNTNNGEYWTEIVPGVVQGNYWTAQTTGATCVIIGEIRNGSNRGCLTGVVIEENLSGAGTRYCFGDPGSGTPCPCGNDNDGSVPESGCANGVFASGAQLTGTGAASVAADTLVLATTGLEPNNAGLYFQAENDLSPGQIWGDGLQCAGGSLKRLGVRFADGTGYSDTSGYPQPISVKAGNVMAGDTKRYQCWYRNIVASPCGSNFNASNGYEVTWTP